MFTVPQINRNTENIYSIVQKWYKRNSANFVVLAIFRRKYERKFYRKFEAC